jgi:PAS domain S-box-containing protein
MRVHLVAPDDATREELAAALARAGHEAVSTSPDEARRLAAGDGTAPILLHPGSTPTPGATELMLQTICDAALDAVVMMDAQGKVAHWNAAAERMFGYLAGEILGENVHEKLVPPAYRDGARQGLGHFFQTGEGRVVGRVLELTALRKDGTEFPIELSVAPVQRDGGWWAVAIIRDITRRKRAERDLLREQKLLSQLLDLHERERKLMAYEIHDGLTQHLTGALYRLQAFRETWARKPDEAWKAFDVSMNLLRQSIDDARQLISGLRPPILDEAGVVEAVDYLVCETRDRTGLTIEFDHDEAFDRLAPPLESTIFRVVQEALTNATRHSGSDRVRIELGQAGGRVRVVVRDWGSGFDPAAVEDGRFGLRGIRERARLLGGKAAVETAPGEGTRVTVELPLVEDRGT